MGKKLKRKFYRCISRIERVFCFVRMAIYTENFPESILFLSEIREKSAHWCMRSKKFFRGMLNSDFPAKKEGKKRKVHMMRYEPPPMQFAFCCLSLQPRFPKKNAICEKRRNLKLLPGIAQKWQQQQQQRWGVWRKKSWLDFPEPITLFSPLNFRCLQIWDLSACSPHFFL